MIDRKIDEALIRLVRLVKEKGGGRFDRVFDDVVKSNDVYLAIAYGFVVGSIGTLEGIAIHVARLVATIDNLIDKGLSDDSKS
jgi:hypothetical protein